MFIQYSNCYMSHPLFFFFFFSKNAHADEPLPFAHSTLFKIFKVARR